MVQDFSHQQYGYRYFCGVFFWFCCFRSLLCCGRDIISHKCTLQEYKRGDRRDETYKGFCRNVELVHGNVAGTSKCCSFTVEQEPFLCEVVQSCADEEGSRSTGTDMPQSQSAWLHASGLTQDVSFSVRTSCHTVVAVLIYRNLCWPTL